jgi:serine/threonine protein kinase
MTRLGKDLQQISDDHGTFDKPTTVFVGVQLITLVQELHQIGFVHNDLKPSSIIAGNFIEPYDDDVIKLIGFGKSTCYTTKPSSMQEPANDSEHVDISHGVGPQNPSRRDDLVSVLYLLVYFETRNREVFLRLVKHTPLEEPAGFLLDYQCLHLLEFAQEIFSLGFKE